MNNLSGRLYIVGTIFLLVGLIFVIRLFNVQVLNDKYKLDSDNNVLREITQYASRGLIYDRKGELLVYNEAAYDLMLIPAQLKEIDTTAFCLLFKMEKTDFIERLNKAKKYSKKKASVFEKEIPAETYARIQEKLYQFSGFYVHARTLRRYPRNSAAHVLGYVGEVGPSTVKKNNYYRSGDYIGKSGVESSYEDILRGKRGVKRILADVHNREKGSYEDGLYDTSAVAGQTIYTTLDILLQEYGEKLMKNKKGSIVAIEPASGEILTMVSNPGYDPNMLVGRSVKKNYPILSNDSLNPLFNRALMAQYPPGSIFKIIQALIGMQDSVISEKTQFSCNKLLVGCHNHPASGSVSSSIKMSCNPYYYNVFKRIILQRRDKNLFKDSELGLQAWSNKVKMFGLGVKLKTDIPSVNKGYVPDAKFYDKWYGKGRWAFSTVYSLSIGQGELGVIPLQMANLAAIVANRGYYYTPHFIKSTEKKRSIPFRFKIRNKVGIHRNFFDPVVDGMYRVVHESGGTAWRGRIKGIEVCGKTGTAQNPHGEDHSVFIAFAPKDDPKIAIAVYVENSGFGGTWAAPIASLMMEKYLTDSISNSYKEQRILDANLLNVKPENK